MSRMKDFVAFRAVLALLQESGKENMIEDVYEQCLAARQSEKDHEENFVKKLYKQFSADQISEKISEIITPPNTKAEIRVVYQTIRGLHEACPQHLGDWYFTGDYPTPGGNRVVNQSFINFVENKSVRAY
jgi:amidophosphoribosyltransferase